jgi:hypothetical protein
MSLVASPCFISYLVVQGEYNFTDAYGSGSFCTLMSKVLAGQMNHKFLTENG